MYSQLIPTGPQNLSTGHRLQTLALCDQIRHFCLPKSSFNMFLTGNTEVDIVSKWMFSWENCEPFSIKVGKPPAGQQCGR